MAGWTSERGRYLFHRQGGLASARSPKHFPIEEALRIRLERIAAHERLVAGRSEVSHELENMRRWLQLTRTQ
jgi:hypothetical protein